MDNDNSSLISSELRYRRLFETAQDGILILSFPGGKVEDANPFVLDMLGYTREEVIGKELWELGFIADEELAKATALKLARDKYVRYDDLNLRTKNGESKEVEFIANVYALNGHSVCQCNIRDISSKRRSERQLAHAVEVDSEHLLQAISALSNAIESRDAYTAGHQARVADLAGAIAQEMGLLDSDVEGIKIAASIHDIGKIAIPSEILTKPAPLSVYEIALLHTHSQAGYEIIKPLMFKWDIAKIVLQHHERMDGSGYPNHLKANEICLEAKILAVADVVEAISSDRPYRPSRGIDEALREVTAGKGVLFDEQAVNACVRLFKEKGYVLPVPTGAKFQGLAP